MYQRLGQHVKDVSGLRTQANKCKFGTFLLEALTGQFMFGIIDKNLSKRLLSTDQLSLDKALNISLQYEGIDRDSQMLSNPSFNRQLSTN